MTSPERYELRAPAARPMVCWGEHTIHKDDSSYWLTCDGERFSEAAFTLATIGSNDVQRWANAEMDRHLIGWLQTSLRSTLATLEALLVKGKEQFGAPMVNDVPADVLALLDAERREQRRS